MQTDGMINGQLSSFVVSCFPTPDVTAREYNDDSGRTFLKFRSSQPHPISPSSNVGLSQRLKPTKLEKFAHAENHLQQMEFNCLRAGHKIPVLTCRSQNSGSTEQRPACNNIHVLARASTSETTSPAMDSPLPLQIPATGHALTHSNASLFFMLCAFSSQMCALKV